MAAIASGGASRAGCQEPGWETFTVSQTGSYATRYLPPSVDTGSVLPVVVFLHGSGAYPHNYAEYVEEAADRAGCVLILPKSKRFEGWGHADDPATIAAALEIVRQELHLNPWRTAVAGHSSGGAYACWLAVATASRFSAAFSLSAPFVTISRVADPGFTAPVRMYYGTQDPNYIAGHLDSYRAQWTRLGVSWQEDVVNGAGHNDWPDSVMEAGFRFLVGRRYPQARWRRTSEFAAFPPGWVEAVSAVPGTDKPGSR